MWDFSSKRGGDVGDDVRIFRGFKHSVVGRDSPVFHQLHRTDSSRLVPPLPAQCHHRDAHIPQYVTLMQHIIPLVNRTTALPPHRKRNQQKAFARRKTILEGKTGETTHLKTNPKCFPSREGRFWSARLIRTGHSGGDGAPPLTKTPVQLDADQGLYAPALHDT